MAHTLESLYSSPNALADHYRRFRVADRLLLTGHSHQAWPDCAYQGHKQAWLDAATGADLKWDQAFARANRVREGFRRLLDDPRGHYSLGSNTHELLVRFLSALPLRKRPQLVTTDCEFHSLRRQADRLAEAGFEIIKVSSLPADTIGERLAAVTGNRTAAVLVSTVFYLDGHLAGDLAPAAEACRVAGAALLLDTYHQLNAVPFSLTTSGLEDAFVVGGGYKYCQMGEGNCFLRFPADCELRPLITGWFAEFGDLTEGNDPGRVAYDRGDQRFAGSTYDPTSHYRASEVIDFFNAHGLEPEFLREISQHQVGLLAAEFDDLDLDPAIIRRNRDVPLNGLGGFLALESPHAGLLQRSLQERDVLTDHRGETLRLGPAPYLSDEQLSDAVALLGEAARTIE